MRPHEDRATLQARRERFAREARAPAPALPANRVAWAGGKISTSDKDECLRRLIERKQRAGEPLTAEQARAAGLLQERADSNVAVSLDQPRLAKRDAPRTEREHAPREPPPQQQQQAGAALAKVQRKIWAIEALEAKAAAGERLEANQREKIARKAELIAELEALRLS